MAPTLVKNDVILVNKSAYLKDKPQSGDIIVFKHPRNSDVFHVFRVVGLPGDHISYRKKVLYVNGKSGTISYQTKYVLEGRDVEEYIEKTLELSVASIPVNELLWMLDY